MSGLNNPIRTKIPNGNLHPSEIQNVNINAEDNIKNKRTILSVQKERGGVFKNDLSDLSSPGRYNFTSNDGDVKIAGSNTKYMFKNLYGETPLTFLFFSGENVNNIQKLIRYFVNKEVGQNIDDQNVTELMVIMRSIFLEYSQHPPLIDELMPSSRRVELLKLYTLEVSRLNQLVINEILPKVISGLQQYLSYLSDISQQPIPNERPKNVSSAGTRTYRSVTQVLTGNQL
jgi:hypothetical protein